MNTRASVLKHATNAVLNSRERTYGTPDWNFTAIAQLHNAWREIRDDAEDYKAEQTPFDFVVEMILTNLVRLAHTPDHFDGWSNIIGYAACGAEVAKSKSPGERK